MQPEVIYPDLVLTEYVKSKKAVFESNFFDLPIVMKWDGDKVTIGKQNIAFDVDQEEKEIPKIDEKHAEGAMEALGRAEGKTFFQCWYAAVMGCEHLYDRVAAYALIQPRTAGLIAVMFYGMPRRAN